MEKKFYSLKELAGLYDISVKTLKKRIKHIRPQLDTLGYDEDKNPVLIDNFVILYSPKQVKMIVELLGEPDRSKK